MKFSSSLKFNAVAEWWDEYIAYDSLKKAIYQLEKQQTGVDHPYTDLESNERTSLIDRADSSATDALFIPLLDHELKKIMLFYEAKEAEVLKELAGLEELVREQDESEPVADEHYMHDIDEDDEDDDDDDDDESPVRSRTRAQSPPGIGRQPSVGTSSRGKYMLPQRCSTPSMSPVGRARRLVTKLKDSITSTTGFPESVWTSRSNYAMDVRLLFKRRITTLYVSVTSLKSYVEVNYSGFRKILKKYDKVTESELKDQYLREVVEQTPPFTQQSKDTLNDAITRLVNLYAKCVTQGDLRAAQRQLRLYQREHVAWERDTVWKQMIGRARRGRGGIDSGDEFPGAPVLEHEPEKGLLSLPTPVGRIKITKKILSLLIAVAVFITLLDVRTVEGVPANRCFAILIFATIMWATEAIPLFVTSILVPLLMACLRVIRSPDGDMLPVPEATKYIFSVMFSPTIMLLIGGFTIASAISKTSIDRLLITRVLSLAGTKPNIVLLAFMGVSCFASMWISNVAAPTLCFTLIRPILRTLPPRSTFAPCLILAIALAANIGGQSSPISSPQNLIALDNMDPKLDWARWFAVAIPVSAISILLIWLLLIVSYRPARSPDGEGDIEIKPIKAAKDSFTVKQYWVVFVCLVTIGLWCIEHELEWLVGDMGIVAIIPIVAFFATGVLKKASSLRCSQESFDDFEQFLWTVVFLAMGGIALGKGVTSSGLLENMDDVIRKLVEGLSLYSVVIVLSIVVLVVSTFISHTIASVLLCPIAKEVGSHLPGDQSNLLVFITGLICSTGMGMPVSGFPNQTAATQEDEVGQLYLSNIDFLKNGVPASIIAALVVATIGFLLMKLVGI
ncbi:SPX-domain-containing protein [Gloeophyllum trabeum ATCC 11539]|uniref:SPX-domain-containing protein n=1 Tax=Gloeophyllum trabeum (strain ATCC 11539 / FP-39264 / Madison 617) TaxID=670483 RepID=S7RI32_GLOTA|nr:SPX-domain-containing protein [Gloeophyllum trabeum ATCC 11539]EPQ53940.1 SPX-domain-containing protein [Gloeophyllum trabeum ATCC 11539]